VAYKGDEEEMKSIEIAYGKLKSENRRLNKDIGVLTTKLSMRDQAIEKLQSLNYEMLEHIRLLENELNGVD